MIGVHGKIMKKEVFMLQSTVKFELHLIPKVLFNTHAFFFVSIQGQSVKVC